MSFKDSKVVIVGLGNVGATRDFDSCRASDFKKR